MNPSLAWTAILYVASYPYEPLPVGDDGTIEEHAPSPVPLVYCRPRPVRVHVRDVTPQRKGGATLGTVLTPGHEQRRARAAAMARKWGYR